MSEKVEDFTSEFEVEDAFADATQRAQREHETDQHRIEQRQKQVDFGKNTVGYQRYKQAVPKKERSKRHPHTPDVHQKTSKRAFDGQIRKWRRALHEWDLPTDTTTTEPKNETGGALPTDNNNKNALPLKIPSAIRPTTKRSRTQQNSPNQASLASLTSPTALPPQSKQARTWAEAVKSKAQSESNSVQGLMMKWREMKAGDKQKDSKIDGNNSMNGDGCGITQGTPAGVWEEVCYSDEEGEGVIGAVGEGPVPMIIA